MGKVGRDEQEFESTKLEEKLGKLKKIQVRLKEEEIEKEER